MKTQHVENIRKKLGVALDVITQYNSKNKNEVAHICDIFNLKEDNNEKVLALLYMLSADNNDDAVKKYREKEELNEIRHDSEILVDMYKIPLLTGLIYNPVFYPLAMNYRGYVNRGLSIRKIDNEQLMARHISQENRNIIIFLYRPVKKYSTILLKTADTQGYFPEPFNKHLVEDINGKFSGELVFLWNRKSQLLELRFQYFDIETKKPVKETPYDKIIVKIKLLNDNSMHSFELNHKINASTIRSDVHKLNLEGGLELCEISSEKS